MEKGKLLYETKPDRGFVFKAWELPDSKGEALIEVERARYGIFRLIPMILSKASWKKILMGIELPDRMDSEGILSMENREAFLKYRIKAIAPLNMMSQPDARTSLSTVLDTIDRAGCEACAARF